MKGKIAFVLGAAVGYVLGTRAGRERYEQIKRGAEQVWNTAPVQRGVDAVRDATRGTLENVKDSALKAGKSAFSSLIGADDRAGAASRSSAPRSGADEPSPRAAQAQSTAHATSTADAKSAKSSSASKPRATPEADGAHA